MTLPVDLVLVRHGQSEGNEAKKRAEHGDHSAYTPEFLKRHTATYRLTEKGRAQALAAGVWLRKEFATDDTARSAFDRCYVSSYARAMETAALLRLPRASWYLDDYLTERDWGELDRYPPAERAARFGEALARRDDEPFFWRPKGGQTFQELCLRVDRVLHTLHRECSEKQVLLACHGEVMRAFQVRIERLGQPRFKELHLSEDPLDSIWNCQIVHYTRRDPERPKAPLSAHADWVRHIRPTENPARESGWRRIVRNSYSNGQLLRLVEES